MEEEEEGFQERICYVVPKKKKKSHYSHKSQCSAAAMPPFNRGKNLLLVGRGGLIKVVACCV